jgi:hypothetical protein
MRIKIVILAVAAIIGSAAFTQAEGKAPDASFQKNPLQRIAFGSCTRQMQDAPR